MPGSVTIRGMRFARHIKLFPSFVYYGGRAIHHPSHGDVTVERTSHHDRRQPHRGGGGVSIRSSDSGPGLREHRKPPAVVEGTNNAGAGAASGFGLAAAALRAFGTWPRQPRDFRRSFGNVGAPGSGVANVSNSISEFWHDVESGDTSAFAFRLLAPQRGHHDPQLRVAAKRRRTGTMSAVQKRPGAVMGAAWATIFGAGNLGDNWASPTRGSHNIGFTVILASRTRVRLNNIEFAGYRQQQPSSRAHRRPDRVPAAELHGQPQYRLVQLG